MRLNILLYSIIMYNNALNNPLNNVLSNYAQLFTIT